MQADLQAFAAHVAEAEYTQIQTAESLIWFHDHFESGWAGSASEIAHLMETLGLSSQVNVSRLRQQLVKSQFVVRAKQPDTFKLSLRSRSALDDRLLPFLARRVVKVSEPLIPPNVTAGARPYVLSLVEEINATYECGFFNSSAVLCRRLIETLLIDVFEGAGHRSSIEGGDGEYIMLSGILAALRRGSPIKLSRDAPKMVEAIKVIGDRAAHHRYYMTIQNDIDEIRADMRVLVVELIALIDQTAGTRTG